jgi:hypothetical protein
LLSGSDPASFAEWHGRRGPAAELLEFIPTDPIGRGIVEAEDVLIYSAFCFEEFLTARELDYVGAAF